MRVQADCRSSAEHRNTATTANRHRNTISHSHHEITLQSALPAADLSQDAERERLLAAFPDIDILVNNAGAIPSGRLEDIPIARWKAAWDLKVIGYVHMCQLYLPAMEARNILFQDEDKATYVAKMMKQIVSATIARN